MKSATFPWLLILATLGLSLWLRFNLVEQDELGFFCDGGGGGARCAIRWLIVQSFNTYGLGYAGVFFGVIAVVTRSAFAACLAATVGMAGLILYTWDFSGLGFLLGALTLARSQFDDYRYQHGAGQQQTQSHPR
jgi:hypothetical protein